jgi:hypothetical protein
MRRFPRKSRRWCVCTTLGAALLIWAHARPRVSSVANDGELAPFYGSPVLLPARIEAEDFDDGGSRGSAISDNSSRKSTG